SVDIDPSGRFVYAANINSNDVSAFGIGATGALTKVDCGTGTACNGASPSNFKAGTNPVSVAVHPSGRFAYVANDGGGVSSFMIAASSGALTQPGAVSTGISSHAIRMDPSGKFAYVVNNGSDEVFAYGIDPATGALTDPGSVRTRQGPVDMAMTQGASAVNYVPQFAYVTDGDGVSIYGVHGGAGRLPPARPARRT